MLAHKEEFFYQNPANLGENLFVWIPPIGHSLLPQGKKKKPDVSGEDASVYWYKTHIHYDYSKEPNVQHAHAGNILATFPRSFPLFLSFFFLQNIRGKPFEMFDTYFSSKIFFSRSIHSNDLAFNSTFWLWKSKISMWQSNCCGLL